MPYSFSAYELAAHGALGYIYSNSNSLYYILEEVVRMQFDYVTDYLIHT